MSKELLNKKIRYLHNLQEIIYQGFCRSNKDVQIPHDIINCCGKFYQINMLKFLSSEISAAHNIKKYSERIWDSWNTSKWYLDRDDYISFELQKLFMHHPNERVRAYSNVRIAVTLTRWKELKEAETLFTALIATEYSPRYKIWMHYHYTKDLLFKHKRYQSALHHFAKVLDLLPKQSSYTEYLGCEATAGMALCYAELDDLENAKTYHLKAIEKAVVIEHKVQCRLIYSRFLRNKNVSDFNDVDAPKKYLLQALEYDKDEYEVYKDLGWICLEKGDYEQSQKYYLHCLRINCRKVDLNRCYAYLMFLMDDYDAAKKHINIEFRIQRRRQTDISYEAYYCHGMINQALGNYDEAEKSFSEAIATVKTEEDVKRVRADLERTKDTLRQHSQHHFYDRLIARLNSLSIGV